MPARMARGEAGKGSGGCHTAIAFLPLVLALLPTLIPTPGVAFGPMCTSLSSMAARDNSESDGGGLGCRTR